MRIVIAKTEAEEFVYGQMHSDLRYVLMFKTNVSDRQIQFSLESNVILKIISVQKVLYKNVISPNY